MQIGKFLRCAELPLNSPLSAVTFSNRETSKIASMSIDLNDPVAVLITAHQALRRAKIETATYGGLALAVYGEPRETKDADLAVAGAHTVAARSALTAAGLNVLIAFDQVQFGGQLVSRLTVFGGLGGSLNTVDLIKPRSDSYSRKVLLRAVTGELRGQQVRIVSPEDFVVLKVLASREQDLHDAASVARELGNRLNLELIQNEIGSLASEITDHDIRARWTRVQQMV